VCLLTAVSVFTLSVAWAQTCKPYNYQDSGVIPPWKPNTTVYVNINSNLNTQQRNEVTSALGLWNQANQNNGSNVTFHVLTSGETTPGGAATMAVNMGTTVSQDGNSAHRPPAQNNTTGCRDGSGHIVCTTITFDTTVMFPDTNGNSHSSLDEAAYPGIFTKAMLHEVGHTMGLPDVTIDTTQGCGGQTAGGSVMNGMCGAGDFAGNMGTNVTNCDKNEVTSINNRTACPVADANACYYSGGIYDSNNCACYGGDPNGGGGGGGGGGDDLGGTGGGSCTPQYVDGDCGYDDQCDEWDAYTGTCTIYSGYDWCSPGYWIDCP
jgi:hypothetical protein